MAGCDAHISANIGRGHCVMPTSQMTAGASTQPVRANGRGGHCGLPTSQITAGAKLNLPEGGEGSVCWETTGVSTHPVRVEGRRRVCDSSALQSSRRTAPLNLRGARTRGGGVRHRHASIHVTSYVAAPCSQRPPRSFPLCPPPPPCAPETHYPVLLSSAFNVFPASSIQPTPLSPLTTASTNPPRPLASAHAQTNPTDPPYSSPFLPFCLPPSPGPLQTAAGVCRCSSRCGGQPS